MRQVSLAWLQSQKNFALLAPGYTDTDGWTLFENLAPSNEQQSRLVLASYDAGPQYFNGAVSTVEVIHDVAPGVRGVQFDDAPVGPAVAHIRDGIAAGDVYQVNFTLRAQVTCDSGAGLLATLCRRGMPRFAAWVSLDTVGEVVSASPELLFERRGFSIHAEPMKGTARPAERELLLASEKDRAELAMITDMLRDDLNHLCEPGSVRVLNERRVIELPYVLQTVSDVTGTLRPDVRFGDIVQQLHPGASITGAPREAARQFIARLEPQPRGFYCGFLAAKFPSITRAALLIRTATRRSATEWVYGVGSGITWGSQADLEAAEIRMKLGVLT